MRHKLLPRPSWTIRGPKEQPFVPPNLVDLLRDRFEKRMGPLSEEIYIYLVLLTQLFIPALSNSLKCHPIELLPPRWLSPVCLSLLMYSPTHPPQPLIQSSPRMPTALPLMPLTFLALQIRSSSSAQAFVLDPMLRLSD